MKKRRRRGFLMWDSLIPWIIAIVVLILVVGVYLISKGKLGAAGEYIRNLMRFGR